MSIPARAHFIWIGSHLPWAYVFAILSAAECGGLDEVVLHHTDTLGDGPELVALRRCGGVELRRIDPLEILRRVGTARGDGVRLATLYQRIESPVMKSDLLRTAILHAHGGIYLDLDTVITRSLRPLLADRQFVGCEQIVWPEFVRASHSPPLWGRSLLLDVLRKPLRRVAPGWKLFRSIERFYYRGINGAVMGAEPRSDLITAYLRRLASFEGDERIGAYAVGPDMLQTLVAGYAGGDLRVHPPDVFYPLPPEISEHWFHRRRKVDLNAVLSPATRVVHWYASVRTRALVELIDPAYIRAKQQHQFYSALVSRCLPGLIDEARAVAPVDARRQACAE